VLVYAVFEVISVLINEVSKVTGLTKKAIVYYVEQNLVVPSALENKYRDFGENDIKRLIKVSVLRKLGIGTEDIRAVLEDETGEFLRRLSVLKVLDLQKEQAKKALLDKLGSGKSYAEIAVELKTIEDSATIAQKILDAFPGYWGRFVCLHFARFLDEPIVTNIQKSAYNRIVSFLDNVTPISLPEDLEEFLS
jgi:DNA-binding transcriptional MerR regulator